MDGTDTNSPQRTYTVGFPFGGIGLGALGFQAAHRRHLTRERHADRFVRTIAPHLRGDDTPHAIDPDAIEEIAASTVRTRGVA